MGALLAAALAMTALVLAFHDRIPLLLVPLLAAGGFPAIRICADRRGVGGEHL